MFFQQGDVLLFPVDSIAASSEKLPHKILAEGEATGHAHRAVGQRAALYGGTGATFLNAPDGCRIIHEEHAAQTIPPGVYEVKRVQEFDPFAEEIRNVVD